MQTALCSEYSLGKKLQEFHAHLFKEEMLREKFIKWMFLTIQLTYIILKVILRVLLKMLL